VLDAGGGPRSSFEHENLLLWTGAKPFPKHDFRKGHATRNYSFSGEKKTLALLVLDVVRERWERVTKKTDRRSSSGLP
jgi:hypothetical protein